MLPEIARAGRLLLHTDDDKPPSLRSPLVWQEGVTWRFCLRLELGAEAPAEEPERPDEMEPSSTESARPIRARTAQHCEAFCESGGVTTTATAIAPPVQHDPAADNPDSVVPDSVVPNSDVADRATATTAASATDDIRDLEEALAIVHNRTGGLVVWPDTLAAVELTEVDPAWIEPLAEHGPPVLERSEIDPLLEALWSQQQQPEILLPAGYRPRPVAVLPQPCLLLELDRRDVDSKSAAGPQAQLELQLEFDYGGRVVSPTDSAKTLGRSQASVCA